MCLLFCDFLVKIFPQKDISKKYSFPAEETELQGASSNFNLGCWCRQQGLWVVQAWLIPACRRPMTGRVNIMDPAAGVATL